MLCVSRSGYYAWRSRPESSRSRENRDIVAKIRAIHSERRKGCYGSPRIHAELQRKGISCSLQRVARLMRVNGIRAQRRKTFKQTTNSTHRHPVAPNLLARDFEACTPNQKWAGDITYLWTAEGWLYLAVILDLFSRMVIGWSLQSRMTTSLVCDALRMALINRLPLGTPMMHSDRGSQYASKDHQRILSAFGISCSMSRKGNCWDNSVSESFFASLKTECVYQEDFHALTRAHAKREVFDYIERFYNRERLHSTLDYCSPVEFEQRHYDSLLIAA